MGFFVILGNWSSQSPNKETNHYLSTVTHPKTYNVRPFSHPRDPPGGTLPAGRGLASKRPVGLDKKDRIKAPKRFGPNSLPEGEGGLVVVVVVVVVAAAAAAAAANNPRIDVGAYGIFSKRILIWKTCLDFFAHKPTSLISKLFKSHRSHLPFLDTSLPEITNETAGPTPNVKQPSHAVSLKGGRWKLKSQSSGIACRNWLSSTNPCFGLLRSKKTSSNHAICLRCYSWKLQGGT